MPSEMRQPDLPDTPELFARIEAGLRQEASEIRSRRLSRLRRVRWYEGLRPALSIAAAGIVVVTVVPAGSPETPAPVMAPVEQDAASGLTGARPDSYLDRLPADDRAAMSATFHPEPRPTPAADMLPLTPA